MNVALFGQTVKWWGDTNSGKKSNMRDEATIQQLLVLENMESYNAILIEQGKTQSERLILLNVLAVKQLQTMKSLSVQHLPQISDKTLL